MELVISDSSSRNPKENEKWENSNQKQQRLQNYFKKLRQMFIAKSIEAIPTHVAVLGNYRLFVPLLQEESHDNTDSKMIFSFSFLPVQCGIWWLEEFDWRSRKVCCVMECKSSD